MAKKPKQTAKGAPPSRPSAGTDLSHLERMLAFMEQHGLEEFEYEHAGLRVRLRKPAPNTHFAAQPRNLGNSPLPEILVAGPGGAGASTSAGQPPKMRAEDAGEGVTSTRDAEDLHLVKSPIVGTFYECPSPGAGAFVKVGDQVTSGQVLCIIEAMKLMNEIESDATGEIVRRYVENGQPVEYGESLFAIRPSRRK